MNNKIPWLINDPLNRYWKDVKNIGWERND